MNFDRLGVTVDCVVFGLDAEDLKILLVERDIEPFEGTWALPGGFVRERENLGQAAQRELNEETGLSKVFLEQLYTFGDAGRDPRGRIVTVAYYALVNLFDHKVSAATDVRRASWFSVDDMPSLAFDHDDIVGVAYQRLKAKIRYAPIGFELLPKKFTLSQLQHLYETVLDRKLDKRNFRKKILSMNFLLQLNEVEEDVSHRAARLFQFDEKRYRALTKEGFNFEV